MSLKAGRASIAKTEKTEDTSSSTAVVVSPVSVELDPSPPKRRSCDCSALNIFSSSPPASVKAENVKYMRSYWATCGNNHKSEDEQARNEQVERRCGLRICLCIVIGASIAGICAALDLAFRSPPPTSSAPAWTRTSSRFSDAALHPGLLDGEVDPETGIVTQQLFIPGPDDGSDSHLALEYSAELDAELGDIFSLDHEISVTDLGCFDGALHLVIEEEGDDAVNKLLPGAVLTGHANWGCSGADLGTSNSTMPQAILHKIVSVVDIPADGATISLIVEELTLNELFKSVNVTYHNSLPNNITVMRTDGNATTVAEPVDTNTTTTSSSSTTRRRELSWWSRFRHHLHGDYNVHSGSHSLKPFKWRPVDSVHVGPLDAHGSGADLSVGVNLQLAIHHWHLKTANLTAVVTPDIRAHSRLTLPIAHAHHTYTKHLIPHESLGSVSFAIGPVPVHLQAILSLTLKADIRADAAITVQTWARATREPSTLGVQYHHHHGWTSVQEVRNASTTTHQHPVTLTASGSGKATLSIEPALSLNVDYLGGPTVTARPHLDLQVDAPTETATTSGGSSVAAAHGCATSEMYAALSWGLNVSVSASIRLKLPGVLHRLDHRFAHFGPETIYSMPKRMLKSMCFA